MVGRTKHDFPQEAPAAPFKTVLLSELKRALVTKRLHNRIPRDSPRRKVRPDWGSDRYVWARRPHHPLIQKANRRAALEIRRDLQSGILIAYLPSEAAGVFHRLSPQFWHEPRSGMRVDGMLFDVAKGKLVPDEVDESTCCIFDQCARAWLKHQKIVEGNPAFPDVLRDLLPIKFNSKPSDEKILSQLLRMTKNGMKRDQAAKQLRTVPGYEGVGNEHARRLMANNLPRGRPRKNG